MSEQVPVPETAQTLDRGLQVLQVLGGPAGRAGVSMTALAEHLGVARAVVYRLVATLADRGFVVRGADGRVRLGPAVGQLAQALRPVVGEVARPVLQRLADEHGATAHLTVVDGGQALAVLVVEPSWTDFHVGYRVGSRHPLTQGAAGRALLAARAGRAEPVVTEGELQHGAHGIAAPVVGVPGVEASLGLVALTPFDALAVGAAVQAAATEVARSLGTSGRGVATGEAPGPGAAGSP